MSDEGTLEVFFRGRRFTVIGGDVLVPMDAVVGPLQEPDLEWIRNDPRFSDAIGPGGLPVKRVPLPDWRERIGLYGASLDGLKDHLLALGQRLAELNNRIDEDDDDSRRSLTEAFRAFNGLAAIIAPDLVVPDDLDDGEE
jgi:hypothetical protein